MERPAKQLSSRHPMVKPSPRTFYVHKQKSLEQLRRISSNSLAGCCWRGQSPASAAPSMFLCRGSCAQSQQGIAGEGWRLLGFCGGVHSPSAPSPISTPPRHRGRPPNARAAAGSDLLPWTFPQTLSEAITGKGPGNHVALDCCQLYKVDREKMAQQTASPDTLAVPEVDNPHCANPWLNEDLVKSLRENLLQNEKSKTARKSVSPKLSPVISPRNSPRLLRRMLLNSNIPKQRRFTVAHTW